MRRGTCKNCLKGIHQWESDQPWFHDDPIENPGRWLADPSYRCTAEPRMESDL